MRIVTEREGQLKEQVNKLDVQLVAARAERDAAEAKAADPTEAEDLKAVLAKVRNTLKIKVDCLLV